jgi:hypothetical protein
VERAHYPPATAATACPLIHRNNRLAAGPVVDVEHNGRRDLGVAKQDPAQVLEDLLSRATPPCHVAVDAAVVVVVALAVDPDLVHVEIR